MKARKYKISKKPLNGVKENTSDHLLDALNYTCRPFTLSEFPKCEDGGKVFEINDKSIGLSFKREVIKQFEKEVSLLANDMSKICLEIQLNQALENEDYERAAELRDKIQKNN